MCLKIEKWEFDESFIRFSCKFVGRIQPKNVDNMIVSNYLGGIEAI